MDVMRSFEAMMILLGPEDEAEVASLSQRIDEDVESYGARCRAIAWRTNQCLEGEELETLTLNLFKNGLHQSLRMPISTATSLRVAVAMASEAASRQQEEEPIGYQEVPNEEDNGPHVVKEAKDVVVQQLGAEQSGVASLKPQREVVETVPFSSSKDDRYQPADGRPEEEFIMKAISYQENAANLTVCVTVRIWKKGIKFKVMCQPSGPGPPKIT